MQNNVNTSVERIIAKIDNDFNPDNSDWIPRVGAWCIDAMSQLDVLSKKKDKRKVVVNGRIAKSCINLYNNDIKVYDSNGCEIKEASTQTNGCGCGLNVPSTGELASETSVTNADITPDTVSTRCGQQTQSAFAFAETVNADTPYRWNVKSYPVGGQQTNHNYVIANCDKIELNFDTPYIFIESEYIETSTDNQYGCELPVIPNNGLLIEALAYYCMYKMLCRGYQHPVFNLRASQYGTNPYYEWMQLKTKAKSSVLNDKANNAGDEASRLMRSNFYIQTFDSRR